MERRSDPYYSDGNIVLSALTQNNALKYFRVHRSILCQSPVFEDMFSLPVSQNMPGDDVYDGQVCVNMPDPAEDLAALLRGMYNPLHICLKPLDPDKPLHIRGVLKLATKYQLDDLRSYLVMNLEADWPSSLEAWDKLEEKVHSSIMSHHQTVDGKINGKYLDEIFPEPAAAISLAKELDIPNILPVAYYHLLRLGPGHNWGGLRKREETSENDPQCFWRCNGGRTARCALLDGEDRQRLARILGRMVFFHTEAVKSIFNNSGDKDKGCRSPERCTEAELRIHHALVRGDMTSPDYLNRWRYERALSWEYIAQVDMCALCGSKLRECCQKERQRFWDSLPEEFGLE